MRAAREDTRFKGRNEPGIDRASPCHLQVIWEDNQVQRRSGHSPGAAENGTRKSFLYAVEALRARLRYQVSKGAKPESMRETKYPGANALASQN